MAEPGPSSRVTGSVNSELRKDGSEGESSNFGNTGNPEGEALNAGFQEGSSKCANDEASQLEAVKEAKILEITKQAEHINRMKILLLRDNERVSELIVMQVEASERFREYLGVWRSVQPMLAGDPTNSQILNDAHAELEECDPPITLLGEAARKSSGAISASLQLLNDQLVEYTAVIDNVTKAATVKEVELLSFVPYSSLMSCMDSYPDVDFLFSEWNRWQIVQRLDQCFANLENLNY